PPTFNVRVFDHDVYVPGCCHVGQRTSTSGAAKAALACCWTTLTMSGGVWAGTNQPCQLEDSKPASPLSATVGTSGSAGEPLGRAPASARSVPAATCGRVVAIGAIATWISPVMRAGKIPASPLYGIGCNSMPAAVLNSATLSRGY